jgi:hypothetical protein
MTTQIEQHVTRIRNAYAELIHHLGLNAGAWIPLRSLREDAGLTRPGFNAALGHLIDSSDVDVMPEANQKTLGPADDDAAYWCGGTWNHLISIPR